MNEASLCGSKIQDLLNKRRDCVSVSFYFFIFFNFLFSFFFTVSLCSLLFLSLFFLSFHFLLFSSSSLTHSLLFPRLLDCQTKTLAWTSEWTMQATEQTYEWMHKHTQTQRFSFSLAFVFHSCAFYCLRTSTRMQSDCSNTDNYQLSDVIEECIINTGNYYSITFGIGQLSRLVPWERSSVQFKRRILRRSGNFDFRNSNFVVL